MKEELLHFIWRYKLLKPGEYRSVGGSVIKILNPGELNSNSGPDFFNARIEIDSIILAGNVEIHLRSSDWLKHGHQNDSAYDKIILHAVYEYDKPIPQNVDFNVEVLELKPYIEERFSEKYNALLGSKTHIPCSGLIKTVSQPKLNTWLDRMLIERLESKTTYIKELFESCAMDYSQTLYVLLARNFGFKLNTVPFELLSRQLPLNILLKHKDNLFQIEALLFGVAGFLDEPLKDKYPTQLQNEFEFLKIKYKLISIDKNLWKFSRTRPANFPSVRLWQFALLLNKASFIFADPFSVRNTALLSEAISHTPENYWKDHLKPDGSKFNNTSIGKSSVENIIINSIAPFLFFYGKQTGKENYIEQALNSFEGIPFESNTKTKVFTRSGLSFNSGGESQALINLYDNYCTSKRCLHCSVGSDVLRLHV